MLARDPWARVTHGDIQVPSSALCGGIITVHHPDMDRAGAGELDRVAMCVCVFVCVFFFFGGGETFGLHEVLQIISTGLHVWRERAREMVGFQ